MSRDRPSIVRVRKEVTGAQVGAAWGSLVTLPELGTSGKLLSVKARLDATLNNASAATAYIADTTDTADAMTPAGTTLPQDGVVFYESAATAFTGHATTADLADTLNAGAGSAYRIPTQPTYAAATPASVLHLGLLVTGTHAVNQYKFYVDIVAEVWSN